MTQAEDKAHNRSHWETLAPYWKAWWPKYKPASQAVSDWMVKHAGLRSESRVLDLATGLGEPAFSFAQAIGPNGFVLGIDQSEYMVEFARTEAQQLGLTNIQFEVHDAETLNLGSQPLFDVLVSRWGLMFFTDLATSLTHLKQYLKPDGRLVAAVWHEPERAPQLSLAFAVLKSSLGIDLGRPGPGPFALADSEHFISQLSQAGFELQAMETVDVVLEHADTQAYLTDRMQTSPILVETLNGLSAEQRQTFEQALEQAIAPWQHDQGISLVNHAYCVSCTLKK